MKINLSSSLPSELETECLVAVVLDSGEKEKSATVESSDNAIREAAKEVIASGEVTGKTFETTLLHHPQSLKAKRLLLLGGGKAKNFSAAELRKLAGAAVRTLKGKSVRSFAFALPENGIAAADAVRAIVEGAIVGTFDPGYYKSDRKDHKIEAVTIVTKAGQNSSELEAAIQTALIVAESQNFARDLIN